MDFNGFHEDKEIATKDNAKVFVKNGNEDYWFEIIPAGANYFVVQTYEQCERTHTSLVKNTDRMWKEIELFVKEVLKND